MMNEIDIHEHPVGACISFKAIIAGAFVAIGLGFLLNLFGAAIGLSAFTLSPSGTVIMVAGGFIGLVIGVIVTQFAAGFVAGYLGSHMHHKPHLGIIYGFTTWSFALVLSAFIITNVSQYTAAYTQMMSPVADNMQPKANVSTATKSSKAATNNKGVENAQEMTTVPRGLATAAFSVFALFFIGALSACLGACIAMPCTKGRSCHSDVKRK